LALTYEQLRRYAEEKSTYERILAFKPNDPVTKSNHAFVDLDSKADTRPLHEVVDFQFAARTLLPCPVSLTIGFFVRSLNATPLPRGRP